MEELPKIDLPEDWLVGTGISKDLLGLYTNFPCQLKAEIFVLCTGGEMEASVNLNRITVKANDFVTITPGTILQIHGVKGDPVIYFAGFSSRYINQANLTPLSVNTLFVTIEQPVVSLKPEGAQLLAEYFQFLIKLYAFLDAPTRKGMTSVLYNNIHTGIVAMYHNQQQSTKERLSKSELICKSFSQLVMLNYDKTRNVAWYAEKLKISNIHLCTTVKKVTGNTCADIISRMVIMDAKSQLKSTNIPIQEISNSLNFANTSFFGKYFKRYVGMSPLAYRNSE